MTFLLVLFPGPDLPLSARFMLDLFMVVSDCVEPSTTLWACTGLGEQTGRGPSAVRGRGSKGRDLCKRKGESLMRAMRGWMQRTGENSVRKCADRNTEAETVFLKDDGLIEEILRYLNKMSPSPNLSWYQKETYVPGWKINFFRQIF